MSTKVVSVEKSAKETMSFTQREVRKEKKKERNAIARFSETQNDDYLRKADECKKKWMDLERNMKVDQEKKKAKMKKKNMTEDEAFEEAGKYNLTMKEECEEKKRLQAEKEANIKELRMKTKLLIKEKSEQKKKDEEKKQSLMGDFNKTQENHKAAFFKKMKADNPGMSDTEIQKNFRRYQFDREKREQYKREIKIVFTLQGIDGPEIDKKIDEYFDFLREEKQKAPSEFPLDFELDDYIEGYGQTMIEEVDSDLEEPISEEEVETQSSL